MKTRTQQEDGETLSSLSHTAAVTMMYGISEAAAQYLNDQGDSDGRRLAKALHTAATLSLETLPNGEHWNTEQ